MFGGSNSTPLKLILFNFSEVVFTEALSWSPGGDGEHFFLPSPGLL